MPAAMKGVRPYLQLDDYDACVDFYKRAFGAKEKLVFKAMEGGPGPVHAELDIPGHGALFVSAAYPDWGGKGTKSLGGSAISLFMDVPNVDRAFERAVKAGAKVLSPPAHMYYGDRSARVADPDGNTWSFMKTVEKLTPKQMLQRHEELLAGKRPMSTANAPGKDPKTRKVGIVSGKLKTAAAHAAKAAKLRAEAKSAAKKTTKKAVTKKAPAKKTTKKQASKKATPKKAATKKSK